MLLRGGCFTLKISFFGSVQINIWVKINYCVIVFYLLIFQYFGHWLYIFLIFLVLQKVHIFKTLLTVDKSPICSAIDTLSIV